MRLIMVKNLLDLYIGTYRLCQNKWLKMFNIFSSFLHEDFFSLDIRKIKKEILNIKSKDEGRIVSNYGGWQSQSLTTINKNFQSLFDNINMSVKKIEKHYKALKENGGERLTLLNRKHKNKLKAEACLKDLYNYELKILPLKLKLWALTRKEDSGFYDLSLLGLPTEKEAK